MKKIYLIAVTMIVALCVLTVPALALETETNVGTEESVSEILTEAISESATEAISEVLTEEELEILLEDEGIFSIVCDAVSGRISVEEAVIALAKQKGLTADKAEALIEKALELGDAYLAKLPFWDSVKASIHKNLEFWIMAMIGAVAVFAVIAGAMLLVVKVARPITRIDFGTNEVAGETKQNKAAISQALGEMMQALDHALSEEKVLLAAFAERDKRHEDLEKKLKEKLSENSELKRNLLDSEMYILQILKLIYSRTDLTLTDKSVLDLWTAKAEESLKKKMAEETLQKHQEMKDILKGDGENG